MNKRATWAIARKDMRAIFANIQIWLPMAVVPLILGFVMPVVLMWALLHYGVEGSGDNLDPILQLLDHLPSSALRTKLEAMPSLDHQAAYLMANYFFAPFFLLIGLLTSSVISADSFAGEKERGTLESLLFSPADLLSLFVGKVLAAFLPAVGLSVGTFLLYGVSVNAIGWKLFGGLFFPHLNWLPLMLLVIPMISLLAVLVNVFISAKVSTFQAAYQMGGLLVLPVIALLLGQVSGLLLLDTALLAALGGALLLLNGLLLSLIWRRLNRSLLFESQIR